MGKEATGGNMSKRTLILAEPYTYQTTITPEKWAEHFRRFDDRPLTFPAPAWITQAMGNIMREPAHDHAYAMQGRERHALEIGGIRVITAPMPEGVLGCMVGNGGVVLSVITEREDWPSDSAPKSTNKEEGGR